MGTFEFTCYKKSLIANSILQLYRKKLPISFKRIFKQKSDTLFIKLQLQFLSNFFAEFKSC